ncbi:MAG TPA: GNAT family N-acetyltransferase [Cellvibrionaceae bacterium]|nr:GNAT family N-acetyltransferase [Cellvibrionaceae bacterium]HMW70409.1 GNAT family N-acetyltransferase [Cellvibrionaceae bacterium]HMY38940.1 GNAT family N-acetyltransferase [Marinagarivorans sp.]HNG58820.1 GNAT family N-acetyltransferase [Cellvibrionaceae bacterium]
MTQRITDTAWPAHQLAISQLRRAVFIDEQQVPEALEWDDKDEAARHFCLWQGETLAAYARLLMLEGNTGKVTRMAVSQSQRGVGLGQHLVQHIIAWARQAGLKTLVLEAQVQAQGFYERQQFVASGEVFWDAGIEHRHMALRL